MSGAHADGHGHGCAADHHRGEYTERQRADLDQVLDFNHRLVQAIESNLDITDTIAVLDPDPLRYMWVDEGDGQIPAQLAKAAAVLEHAPRLAGQNRGAARVLPDSQNASRPTVAVHGATMLVAWLEWQEDRGDRLLAELRTAGGRSATVVVDEPQDLFRPTAAVTSDGVPWLVFGRSVDGQVGVWASQSSRAGGASRSRSATPEGRRSTRRSSPSGRAACRCAGRARSTTASASSPAAGTAPAGSRRRGSARRGRATSGTRP